MSWCYPPLSSMCVLSSVILHMSWCYPPLSSICVLSSVILHYTLSVILHYDAYSVCAEVLDGFESLHVKVMKVVRESPARRAGVHCQMYLKSLALSVNNKQPTQFAKKTIIGASSCRKGVTQTTTTKPDDPWAPTERNCLDMNALITSVDRILSEALLYNKIVQAEFVEYIE